MEHGPQVHQVFDASWTAEILPRPPLIAPARAYTWPKKVAGEEDALARGALYVMVKPNEAQPFLLTCALGFESPELPAGVWTCPNADDICAVAGGYAYIANIASPDQPTLIEQRPVTEIRANPSHGLLLLAGFHDIVAWGAQGIAWRTRRITDEGLKLGAMAGDEIFGTAWDMRSDKEIPFTLDVRTGEVDGGVQR